MATIRIASLSLEVADVDEQAQYARPISDTAAGFWTASTGTDLYEMVNETEALLDDADYIQSDATPIQDAVEFALTPLEWPITGTTTIRIRGWVE